MEDPSWLLDWAAAAVAVEMDHLYLYLSQISWPPLTVQISQTVLPPMAA